MKHIIKRRISLEEYYKMVITEYSILCMGCLPYTPGKTIGESLEVYITELKDRFEII